MIHHGPPDYYPSGAGVRCLAVGHNGEKTMQNLGASPRLAAVGRGRRPGRGAGRLARAFRRIPLGSRAPRYRFSGSRLFFPSGRWQLG